MVDLGASTPIDIEIDAKHAVNDLVNETIDLTSGPLFAARLIRLTDHDHLLVIAMDHLISDGFSLSILSRDLWTLYFDLTIGLSAALPEMPVQFPDYTIWQRKARRWWYNRHGRYWEERLSKPRGARHPLDPRMDPSVPNMPAQVSVQLPRDLCNELRELSYREHTTLPLVVLAAYTATILRWQDKSEFLVGMVVHGRTRPELVNMIGFIASELYLRIALNTGDDFLDLLERVTNEYYTACAHHTLGYIALQSGTTEFTSRPCFNWLPPSVRAIADVPIFDGGGAPSAGAIRLDPFPFTQVPVNYDLEGIAEQIATRDPYLTLTESADGVSCTLWYVTPRFNSTVMEDFLHTFHATAEELLQHPHAQVMIGRHT